MLVPHQASARVWHTWHKGSWRHAHTHTHARRLSLTLCFVCCSALLWLQANSQVVMPHKTCAYGDSVDAPEESIPMCTLRHFPHKIEHCIEWARDKFDVTLPCLAVVQRHWHYLAPSHTHTALAAPPRPVLLHFCHRRHIPVHLRPQGVLQGGKTELLTNPWSLDAMHLRSLTCGGLRVPLYRPWRRRTWLRGVHG